METEMTTAELNGAPIDGLDSSFGNTSPMGGIPDNPQAAIPGYYVKLNKGMTHEEILAEHLASGGTGSGTSIFDPVLCELAYRWFSPPDGSVLDPFAGGSVRGVVASMLGRNYTGVDLSGVQVGANEQQARKICSNNFPRWIVGDAAEVKKLAHAEYDFIFSCPPYHDLEKYSDDPRDLSVMDWDAFLASYRSIISQCCDMLRNDRFACFVVGDIRGADGCYRGLPEETVRAFTDCGLKKYNEMILVTAVGSLGIRVGKQFGDYRKVGKTHQNVLVFLKGDWRAASAAVGPVDISVEPLEFGELIAAQPADEAGEQGANLRLAPAAAADTPAGFDPVQFVNRLPDATAAVIRDGIADGSLRLVPEFRGGKLVSVGVFADDGTPMLSSAELQELMQKSATSEGCERGHKGLPPESLGGPAAAPDRKITGGLGGEI